VDSSETATEGNGVIKRNCNRTFQSGGVPEGVTRQQMAHRLGRLSAEIQQAFDNELSARKLRD
jgi:hypothetical protein